MLVLGRKVGEEIIFPGLEARIVVTRIEPNRVSLGFDFPAGIEILRKELLTKGDVPSVEATVSNAA